MAIKGGLGKGLGALLKDTQIPDEKGRVQEIPVVEIRANRYQPRADFDETELEALKESINRYGVLQPVLVRRLPASGYELIAGERRLRAARLAGLKKIPALVRESSDAEMSEIALIENIQRADLNAMEEAHAYERLLNDFSLTQEELAARVGRSRSHIANFLRLLNLAPKVQTLVANGSLSMGQAKPLLALPTEALQEEAADVILEKDFSARQTETLVKEILAGNDTDDAEGMDETEEAAPHDDIYLRDAVDRLQRELGTKVKIKQGKKKSRLEIEFYSEEDLERIIAQLLRQRTEQADDGGDGTFTV